MTFEPQLAKTTRQLLRDRPRSLTLDAIATATGLSKAWITDFAANPDRDHGVNKVETLCFYLSKGASHNDSGK